MAAMVATFLVAVLPEPTGRATKGRAMLDSDASPIRSPASCVRLPTELAHGRGGAVRNAAERVGSLTPTGWTARAMAAGAGSAAVVLLPACWLLCGTSS